MTDLAIIKRIFDGSDGEATRMLYRDLEALGPRGAIAINLFRACKCSARAKMYRKGPGHRTAAYERKDWSLQQLAGLLAGQQSAGLTDMPWGWGVDADLQARLDPHHHILYVDLPTGQVSFHCGTRHAGPDYAGAWDGERDVQAERVCRYVAEVFKEAAYV